ncbi:lipopolysaccharide assembly protein LapA domain-containing protein [Frankia sp. Cr2]|uniref:lipopolysaccharide assembly protein LapA domain-containing protein n=1 Tax=Frankia sp. Cr2 TaxID=3073932 RepID=UPI002AD4850C|nr:lipopolysaccharide assembly protein LapA domain-containing protein [Frankia sp. Cr2]
MTTPGDQSARKIDYTRPAVPSPTGSTPPPVPAAPGPAPATPGGTGPAPESAAQRRGIGYTTYAVTVLVLLIAIAVIMFVLKNNARVNIWLFGSFHNMSVAGALAASATAGLVIGLLIGLITQIKVRKEVRQYRRGNR